MAHWLLLTVIIVLVVAAWVGYNAWFPLRRCPRCKNRPAGSGSWSRGSAYNKRCRRCRGPDGKSTGEIVRPTARLLNTVFGMPIRGSKEK